MKAKGATIRVRTTSTGFAMMNKGFLLRPEMSAKAKGILAYLIAHGDGWVALQYDVVNNMAEGKDAIRSGFAELKRFGYLRTTKSRNDKGHWQYDTIVSDAPLEPEPSGDDTNQVGLSDVVTRSDYPTPDNPPADKPTPGYRDAGFPDDIRSKDLRSKDSRSNDLGSSNSLEKLEKREKREKLEPKEARAEEKKEGFQIPLPPELSPFSSEEEIKTLAVATLPEDQLEVFSLLEKKLKSFLFDTVGENPERLSAWCALPRKKIGAAIKAAGSGEGFRIRLRENLDKETNLGGAETFSGGAAPPERGPDESATEYMRRLSRHMAEQEQYAMGKN